MLNLAVELEALKNRNGVLPCWLQNLTLQKFNYDDYLMEEMQLLLLVFSDSILLLVRAMV